MTIAKIVLGTGVLLFPLLTLAASPGEQCRDHFVHGRYMLAVQPCTVAAEQGDLNAQNWLGLIFFKGKGVAQDYKQSFKWRRLAAEQGDSVAQFNLGRMYELGLGVEQDYGRAIFWYRKSIDQGNADAQYSMASLYRGGKGVARNKVMAYAWYSLAADQGLYLAVEPRDSLQQTLSSEELMSAEQTIKRLKTAGR
jgi:TPR repeat protein